MRWKLRTAHRMGLTRVSALWSTRPIACKHLLVFFRERKKSSSSHGITASEGLRGSYAKLEKWQENCKGKPCERLCRNLHERNLYRLFAKINNLASIASSYKVTPDNLDGFNVWSITMNAKNKELQSMHRFQIGLNGTAFPCLKDLRCMQLEHGSCDVSRRTILKWSLSLRFKYASRGVSPYSC